MLNRQNTSENLKDVIRIKDSEKETAIINFISAIANLIAALTNLSTEIVRYPNSIMNLLSSYSWLIKWIVGISIYLFFIQTGIMIIDINNALSLD